MANDLDEQSSNVAMTLMARYEVDQESVRQTARDVEEAEGAMARLREEKRAVELRGFVAGQEEARQRQVQHFSDLENALEVYWQRRLQMVRGNADEERRIIENLSTDLLKLEDMRRTSLESSQNQAAAGMGATGATSIAAEMGIGGNLSGALSSIGWGSIMGMASFAGMAGLMAQSVAQIREARGEAREVGEIAMRDPDFAFGLAPSIQQMRRETAGRISPGDFARIATELAPIARPGLAGGQQVGELTEQAIGLGTAMGVDPQVVTRLMRQFAVLEGTALPNLSQRVLDVAHQAEAAGIPMRDYVTLLSQMVEEGRAYNRTIPESARLVTLFGRELQEGTITIGEINKMQGATATAGTGAMALLGQRFIQQGGPVGQFLEGIGATDPYSSAIALRALAQGGMPTATGEVVGPSEQTGAQQAQVRRLREMIQAGAPELVQGMVAETGATGMMRAGIQQQLMGELFGVQARTMAAQQDLTDAMAGRKEALPGITPRAPGRPRTLDEYLAEGERSIQESISMLDRFKSAVGDVTDSLVLQAQLVAAYARGDDKEVARLTQALGEYAGEGTPGARFYREAGGARGLSMMNPFALLGMLGAGAGQASSRVVIENRAKDEVEVHEQTRGHRLIAP